ncbi:MAG: hypothetical protein M1816_003298 [Peltula sp. TS41687]|nr:MAG: hypothetical protein M1816_003298 [Peltula sp. TS41687]
MLQLGNRRDSGRPLDAILFWTAARKIMLKMLMMCSPLLHTVAAPVTAALATAAAEAVAAVVAVAVAVEVEVATESLENQNQSHHWAGATRKLIYTPFDYRTGAAVIVGVGVVVPKAIRN